ncbi:MAG: hypothetical protein K9J82_15485 [Methylotenera sp.]|jgi:hypothetical protein|nr:hypothetical protein [Methylotenera sp.]
MRPAVGTAVEALVSRDHLARAKNLSDYIRAARNESKALVDDWDVPFWPGVGYFVKQSHAPRGSMSATIPLEAWLDDDFLDFAKAYVVERFLTNPGLTRAAHIKRLQVLRLLEASLLALRDDASPLGIDGSVLEAAATLARQTLVPAGAYKVGAELERLADVLVRAGVLAPICGTWTNPNKQPKNTGISVDAKAEAARQQRLPDHDALYALADIFNRDLDPADERFQRDIITTSAMALLMCAPSRGQEIFRLPANLVFEATDKFGKEQIGLRLHASKGFGAYVKWVWSGMVPVAERAIARVRTVSEAGRALAHHLEDPKLKRRFYRHAGCPPVADNEPLTKWQVCAALGYNNQSPAAALNKNGLSSIDGTYTLQQLWDTWVLPRLAEAHPHFPYVSATDKALGRKGGLKFSEALFCTLRYQLNLRAGTSPVQLFMSDLTDLNFDLGPSATKTSIFERYGFCDAQGAPLKLTSHQIRHLVNTEAQRVGLTDEQIAHWSGRRRVDQNAVYDHRTLEERVEQTRDVVESVQAAVALPVAAEGVSYTHGQWTVKVVRKPRLLADVEDVQPQLSGLKTLYGECHHDWSFAPCEGFVKCLDCSEHACIKGDDDAAVKLERLRSLHASVLAEVEKAAAVANDDVDAKDWLDVQQRYAAKVGELISLLQSETVPDGSVIRTAQGENPTHLHRALRGLASKALADGAGSAPAMKQLLVSLETGLAASQAPLLETRAGVR